MEKRLSQEIKNKHIGYKMVQVEGEDKYYLEKIRFGDFVALNDLNCETIEQLYISLRGRFNRYQLDKERKVKKAPIKISTLVERELERLVLEEAIILLENLIKTETAKVSE